MAVSGNMQIPPPYQITNEMLSSIAKIEANREALKTLAIPETLLTNLRRETLLKSSVFSAQIEGNQLSLNDVTDKIEAQTEIDYEHQEVENIITALSFMRQNSIPEIIDLNYILNLHKQVMHKLIHTSQTGVIRQEPSAIFDQSGNVIYMTPPPSQLQPLLSDLLKLINQTSEVFPLIKASLAHLCFEKIHPFLDGNGRVGRLLMQALLAKHDYHFQYLLSIEEGLQERKQTYYALLDRNDATAFIEFILSIMIEETDKLKTHIADLTEPKPEDFLLPRRKEILTIIKEHNIVSFDRIHRRFLKIPDRTLRYDLQQLEKSGFIQKIGTTRGAMYQIRGKK